MRDIRVAKKEKKKKEKKTKEFRHIEAVYVCWKISEQTWMHTKKKTLSSLSHIDAHCNVFFFSRRKNPSFSSIFEQQKKLSSKQWRRKRTRILLTEKPVIVHHHSNRQLICEACSWKIMTYLNAKRYVEMANSSSINVKRWCFFASCRAWRTL